MIHFGHESAGGFMRGRFRDQGGLFSYLCPEARVPAKHPLRQVRELVRAVLKDLSPSFGKLYSSAGRPSIPPEQLLSALLLQVFYGIRSERQLMEQLDYNLLYRWFAGLAPDDPVWDTTTFTKNRDRLQHGEVFQKFMTKLLNHPQVKPLLSDEHFSVDGTLIEAWASHKSFRPKDGSGDEDGGANFHGQQRKNDTHASTSDPDSRLYRKAAGREAKLCYMGHATMENRHGLAVAGMVTAARIAGARMRVVFALRLAAEAAPAVVVAAAVLGAETLVRGPRLDQRSVHRKMLVRQQRLDLRMVQKFGHELGTHRAGLQPIAVLREGRRVPDRVPLAGVPTGC